jgi:C_GCAxxG_C_C family probable redox protein
MGRQEIADSYHDRGYGCAQSVLAAFCTDYGLDEETALRLATGFGSGMGRMCEVCGALTGGFMVIGLKFGKVLSDGSKYGTDTETTYRLVGDMAHAFEARNGAIKCRDLLGLDLSLPEARERAVSEGLFAHQCAGYIRDAVEILEKLID